MMKSQFLMHACFALSFIFSVENAHGQSNSEFDTMRTVIAIQQKQLSEQQRQIADLQGHIQRLQPLIHHDLQVTRSGGRLSFGEISFAASAWQTYFLFIGWNDQVNQGFLRHRG